jgi:hypothetical protein
VENAVIKKVSGKFQLWTADGKRPLALAQERAIKARQAAAAKGR